MKKQKQTHVKPTAQELIRSAGMALFGVRFQADLADKLDVHRRTLIWWISDEPHHRHPPYWVWPALLKLLSARADLLNDVSATVRNSTARISAYQQQEKPTPK